MQTLILLFKNDRAFLTPEKSFTMQELEFDQFIPQIIEGPVAWRLQIRRYFAEQGRLSVDVADYAHQAIDFPEEQLAIADQLGKISTLSIRNISTFAAQSSLGGGSTIRNPIPHRSSQASQPTKETLPPEQEPTKKRTKPVRIDKITRVPFESVNFVAGGIKWTTTFREYPAEVELFLPNPSIREDLDAVKGYFAKVLKAEYLKIHVKAEVIDGRFILREIHSPEIGQIDHHTLDKARLEIYRSVKAGTNQTGKQREDETRILAEEQLLAELNQDLKLVTTEDIVNQIAAWENSLHYLQLSYLARHQLSKKSKLLFLTKPTSFIFTLHNPTTKRFYLVWETVNTEEATYIWEHPPTEGLDLTKLRRQVEATVQDILEIGKNTYINRQVPNFYRVIHNYQEKTAKQGFAAWLAGFQKVVGEI